MRRTICIALLLAALATIALFIRRRESEGMQQQSRFLMDTYCTIRVPGPASAQGAITSAFKRMEDIDRRFNALNPRSPVHRFNEQGQPIEDPDIVGVVKAALEVAERTNGAFDPTVYPLVEQWGFYGDGPMRVPTEAEIADALRHVGWRNVAIEGGRVTRRRPDTKIDLGGIAKGYAVGEAVRALKEAGIHSALVDAGGDVHAFGQIDGRAWRIGIRNPRGDGIVGALNVSNESAVTSGDYERFFEKDGVRYHHILNPATGRPASGIMAVTIVSSNATMADAWSTAVFVMGAAEGLRLIETLPGVEAVVVTDKGAILMSSGLKNRLHVSPAANASEIRRDEPHLGDVKQR